MIVKALSRIKRLAGVARNFDWEGAGKNRNVILVTFFGDVMVITSLK